MLDKREVNCLTFSDVFFNFPNHKKFEIKVKLIVYKIRTPTNCNLSCYVYEN